MRLILKEEIARVKNRFVKRKSREMSDKSRSIDLAQCAICKIIKKRPAFKLINKMTVCPNPCLRKYQLYKRKKKFNK